MTKPSQRGGKMGLAAFALALALSPGLALAGEAPACKGRDLSGDPGVKPNLAAHADELMNSEGLLWKVERPNLAPSYLFGTIHSTNAAAIAIAGEAAAYIDGAKSVATELGGPLDAEQKVEMSAGLVKAAVVAGEDTLKNALPARDAETVETYLGARGLPPEMAHHLKLWFLAVAASLPACEAEAQLRALPEVDQLIAQIGAGHGLPVVALETVAEQTQTLASVPDKIAVQMLAASARAPELNDDGYATLLALYRGKHPALAIPILDAMPGLTAEERAAETEFTRLLMVGRNELMMKRAAPLLAKGGAFVAVGALHLSGKGGLIERARTAGYVVTKVW
jgi:uncharacterized protein YbaP (TraB family)